MNPLRIEPKLMWKLKINEVSDENLIDQNKSAQDIVIENHGTKSDICCSNGYFSSFNTFLNSSITFNSTKMSAGLISTQCQCNNYTRMGDQHQTSTSIVLQLVR